MYARPLSDLFTNWRAVRRACRGQAVSLTMRGEGRFVIVPQRMYDRMIERAPDPREVFEVSKMPPERKAELLEALEQTIREADARGDEALE
jgi:prevent-host-death family protein